MSSPPEISQLGPLVKRFRLAAGLSQEELAERSGVSARAISDFERGLRSVPRLETVRMLADALALSDDDRSALLAASRPEVLSQRKETPLPSPPSAAPRSTAIPLGARPLPVPLDQLIGRDEDIARTTSLLLSQQVRLITLTGPGGVGKTRLSLAIAERSAPAFQDGAAFVDLAPLTRAEHLAPSIIDALGIAVDPRLPALDALRAALRSRSLLLLLDNFEHLLDAAPVVSDLLLSCPSLKVLITSRVRLHLRGERVVLVCPLETSAPVLDGSAASLQALERVPAIQLFVDRAAESRFDFAMTGANASAIVDICRRLDGLPLAIELAASRVGILAPEALLARLDRRLPTLTDGARDAPERQRTLRDTIAWSYDLLNPPEQTVFRRLAVFSGGFSYDTAVQVAGTLAIDVTAAIDALAENSLLSAQPASNAEPRFAMLETVHEFSESIFEATDEATDVRCRHADWIINLAERADAEMRRGLHDASWCEALDSELPEIRSALHFLLESHDGPGALRLLTATSIYWFNRPYQREYRHWLEIAIPLAPDAPGEVRAMALAALAYTAGLLGDIAVAAGYVDQALELARSLANPNALGMAYFIQAVLAEFSGDIEKAAARYEQSLALLREAQETRRTLICMGELGGKWLLLGKVEQAVALIDESVAAARQHDSEIVLTNKLIQRAFAALAQDDVGLAAALFTEGLSRSREYTMSRSVLGSIAGLAGVGLAIDQPEAAARLLGAVEAANNASGAGRFFEAALAERVVSDVRSRLGEQAFQHGKVEGSSMTYEEAIDAALTIGRSARAGATPESS